MPILQEGSCHGMSVVIGIAGENFCSLVSDGRRMINLPTAENPHMWRVDSDECQKVYRLNANVIMGGTGIFQKTETVLTPIGLADAPHTASVRVVHSAVRDFLNRHKKAIVCPRNYIIGGRENDGGFCLYQVHFDPTAQKIESHRWEPKKNEFAVVCALPASLAGQSEHYTDMVHECITSSRTHGEMLKKVEDIITGISEIDDWVGGQMYAVSIT